MRVFTWGRYVSQHGECVCPGVGTESVCACVFVRVFWTFRSRTSPIFIHLWPALAGLDLVCMSVRACTCTCIYLESVHISAWCVCVPWGWYGVYVWACLYVCFTWCWHVSRQGMWVCACMCVFPGVATLCVCGCVYVRVYLPGVGTYLGMCVCACVCVRVYLPGVGTCISACVYVRACVYTCIYLGLARISAWSPVARRVRSCGWVAEVCPGRPRRSRPGRAERETGGQTEPTNTRRKTFTPACCP